MHFSLSLALSFLLSVPMCTNVKLNLMEAATVPQNGDMLHLGLLANTSTSGKESNITEHDR